MKSLWSDAAAQQSIETYAASGVNDAIALRVYTSRLLGSEPRLVSHGGGNTSVKTVLTDMLGHEQSVLCVKGSGWDLETIEPEGLPAVRMAPLHEVREREHLSDEDMVRLQRSNLLDPNAPNPSVETLLHAYLPHKYVDHTHAIAVLSVSDQEDGIDRLRDIFGDSVAIVPYVMPGFELAKATAAIYDANPIVEGIILHKHGIFTFGDSAQESYERMIGLVTQAENYVENTDKKVLPSITLPTTLARLEDIAPIVRGACAEPLGQCNYRRWILEHRGSDSVMEYVNGRDLSDYGARGVITPDHIIRTKNRPLLLPAPDESDLQGFSESVSAAVADYQQRYDAYFEKHNATQETPKTRLDSLPRLVFVPGIGLFGLGRSRAAASVVADLAELTITTVSDAERIGSFQPLGEADLFDMEYWSLEQAKLGKKKELPLQGQVALITGGAGAIGRATAALFAANGCEVALFDVNSEAVVSAANEIGPDTLAIAGDVTSKVDVARAIDDTVRLFGGVDIVVSNAGAAWQGQMDELDEAVLRRSFELNFFAHQSVAQAAVQLMKRQGTGGALLFNASKQAVNPGSGFGAYGLPKAATLFLSRQYAIECGQYGIRSNAVNADRIRSGLLTDEMIDSRSAARGVTRDEYLAGNLLGVEVEARHVAEAFLQLALATRTTAGVATVDGGNVAAALR